MPKLWVQKWEESEAGWGTRPDGYTLHLNQADIDLFLADMRTRERRGKPEGYVPPEYSRPDGEPYEWETDDEALVARVRDSGRGCWGPGRVPPPPAPGVRPGGWTAAQSSASGSKNAPGLSFEQLTLVRRTALCDPSVEIDLESLGAAEKRLQSERLEAAMRARGLRVVRTDRPRAEPPARNARTTVDPTVKIQGALDILRSCLGRHGVYADPTRYNWQCWTRDLALAIQPVLPCVPGGAEAGERHLHSLARRQRDDGKLPIVFLDGALGAARFLLAKTTKSIVDGKLSFMLRRYLAGQLGDLTPGTRDSELMFMLAIAQRTGPLPDDLGIAESKARVYIEDNLLDKRGMLLGADWRDTMEKELADQPLLSNNAIWHGLLRGMRLRERAGRLRTQLRARVEGGVLVDYPGAGRFDPLGGALSILHGVVDAADADWMVDCFRSVDSPRGVTIRCRHNPLNLVEGLAIDQTDGVVVWPFVVGFAALALHRLGTPAARALAREQLDKLLALDGFCEWYNPTDGRGYGATKQLWSAALTLRACREILGPGVVPHQSEQ